MNEEECKRAVLFKNRYFIERMKVELSFAAEDGSAMITFDYPLSDDESDAVFAWLDAVRDGEIAAGMRSLS